MKRILLTALAAVLWAGSWPLVAIADDSAGISGLITDSSGSALSGMCVVVHELVDNEWGKEAGPEIVRVKTLKSGRYNIRGMTPGSYLVHLGESAEGCATGYIDEWFANVRDMSLAANVTVEAGSITTDIDAVLARPSSIAGVVTDSGGSPLTGICVDVIDDSPYDRTGGEPRSGITDSAGAYTIGGLRSSDYKVRFFNQDCANDGYANEWFSGKLDFSSADIVSVPEETQVLGINEALASSGLISGLVTDVAGAPISSARISAMHEGSSFVFVVEADDAGSFTIGELPAGDYALYVFAGSEGFRSQWYKGKQDRSSADLISVAEGQTTGGITITLCGYGTDADSDGLTDCTEVDMGTDPLDADSDGDGLTDGQEASRGTSPNSSDSDSDGLSDGYEVENGTDPLSADSDADGLTDGEEVAGGTDPSNYDTDGDGLSDGDEIMVYATNPNSADSDSDGASDADEIATGSNPNSADSDGDGLSDGEEAALGTDPLNSDSDGDGLSDGDEVHVYGTNPNSSDSDSDGITDGAEVAAGTNPNSSDSDGDGLSDSQERDLGTNPNSPDTDSDGLTDGDEVGYYDTNPNDADSDDDGLSDGDEIAGGSNPNDRDSDGDLFGDGFEAGGGECAGIEFTGGSDPTHPLSNPLIPGVEEPVPNPGQLQEIIGPVCG